MIPICRPLLLMLYVLLLSPAVFAATVIIEPKPIDTVEFTCNDFKQKTKTCATYTCQTPFYRDPTVKMTWKIEGQKDSRCVISYTTYDLGLKDENDNTLPITQTCEYDEDGIKTLRKFMDDMEKGYFHPILGEDNNDTQGIYNCTFTSNGKPVKSTFSDNASE